MWIGPDAERGPLGPGSDLSRQEVPGGAPPGWTWPGQVGRSGATGAGSAFIQDRKSCFWNRKWSGWNSKWLSLGGGGCGAADGSYSVRWGVGGGRKNFLFQEEAGTDW